MPFCHRGEARCNFVSELKEVDRSGAKWDLPRLERGEVEHLIRHLDQVQHLHLNLAGAFVRAARITPLTRRCDRFREESDRAEWRAKFMREIVNKL